MKLAGAVAAAVVLLLGSPAAADQGDRDPSFDGDGIVVRPDLPPAAVVALDGEGRVLTAALRGTTLLVTRHGDATFGGDGTAEVPLGGGTHLGELGVDPTGDVVVLGSREVVRLSSSGTVEHVAPVAHDAGGFPRGGTQPDGTVIVSHEGSGWIEAIGPDGRADPSWGDGGALQLPADTTLSHLAVGPEGELVVLGITRGERYGTGPRGESLYERVTILARYDDAGVLDGGFGEGGTVGGGSFESGLAIAPDGDVLVSSANAVQRWTPDGRPDLAWSGDGIAPLRTDVTHAGVHVLPLADGSVVTMLTTPHHVALARLAPDGRFDTSFGDCGIAVAAHGSRAHGLDAAVRGGRIAVAGIAAPWATDRYLQQQLVAVFQAGTGGPRVRPQPGTGFWTTNPSGWVGAQGTACHLGDMHGKRLNRPVVGIAGTPSGEGYWLVASDGGIFSFGDAEFRGSTGAMRLNRPIVGVASTPSGRGYWLVASDGGIFTYGDAGFFGSTGAILLNQPIVAMAPTRSGRGYWLVAADGGVFTFGDARFLGSDARSGGATVVDVAATPSGRGYWLLRGDESVRPFGDAAVTDEPAYDGVLVAAGLLPSPTGRGYRTVGRDGAQGRYGDALYLDYGNAWTAQPVVGVAGR